MGNTASPTSQSTNETLSPGCAFEPGEVFRIREAVWPLNTRPTLTGEIEEAIMDPVEGPIYRVFLDDYELTTVYEWEIEKTSA